MNAVFRKEFRDLLPWIPVGMLLSGVLLYLVAPRSAYMNQAVEQGLLSMGGIGCVIIALAFGLLQSIPDTRTEAKGYLLHRPVPVANIFWGKFLAGLAAYACCLLPGYLAMAWYLEWKGPEQLPTCGAQMWPLVAFSVVLFAMHPAAMWSTFRQASWWGSKWFPFGAAFLGLAMAWAGIGGSGQSSWLFPAAAVITLWGTIAAARHAFCHEQFLPSARKATPSFAAAVGFITCGMFLIGALGFVYSLVKAGVFSTNQFQPYTVRDVAMTEDGKLWEVAEKFNSNSWTRDATEYSGRVISGQQTTGDLPDSKAQASGEQKPDLGPLPEPFQQRPSVSFSNILQARRSWQFNVGYFSATGTNAATYAFEHHGRLLGYGQFGGLNWVITPRGVYEADEVPEGRFESLQQLSTASFGIGRYLSHNVYFSGKPLLADKNGVYQIDLANRSVRKILDEPIEHCGITLPVSWDEPSNDSDRATGQLWTLSGDQLKRHEFVSTDEENPLERTNPVPADEKAISHQNYFDMPPIEITDSTTRTVEPLAKPMNGYETLIASATSTGVTALLRRSYAGHPMSSVVKYEMFGESGDEMEQGQFVEQPLANQPAEQLAWLPPITWPIAAILAATVSGFVPGMILVIAGHAIVAALLASWVANVRGLSRQIGLVWTIAAAALGLGVPLAMWFLHGKIYREKCPQCDAPRRIDLDRCESCKAEWQRPELQGNEILGVRPLDRTPTLV